MLHVVRFVRLVSYSYVTLQNSRENISIGRSEAFALGDSRKGTSSTQRASQIKATTKHFEHYGMIGA
jgi:hypothetical protein